MKTELEPQDVQAIAEKVLDLLKPHLSTGREQPTNDILDMPGLCEYLKVSPKWVHERTHLKQIPFHKLSNKQLRFRRRDIDKWLESLRTPALNDPPSRMRLLK